MTRRATEEATSGDGAPAPPPPTGVLFVCLGNICRSPSAEAVFRAVVERRGLADRFLIDSCGTGGGASNVRLFCLFFLGSGNCVASAASSLTFPPRPPTPPKPTTRQWFKPGGFSYHEGDPSDARMTAAAARRGVKLTSRSRPLRPEDWSRFRHVVCMDGDNVRAVQGAVQYWEGAGTLGADNGGGRKQTPATPAAPRVSLMTDWAAEGSESRRLGKVPDPYYGGPAGFDKVLDLLDEAAEGLLDAVLAEEEGAAV